MISTNFPTELRSFFKNNSDIEEAKIESFFKDHPFIQQAFLSWSENHIGLVQNTPRLYKALCIANHQSKAIDDCKVQIVPLSIIHKILSSPDPKIEEFPVGYIENFLLLFEAGIINKKNVCDLFFCKDLQGRTPRELSYLRKLDFHQLIQLFSIKPLSLLDQIDPNFLLSFLRALNFDQLKHFFSTKNIHEQLFSSSKNCENIIPLLKELPSSQLKEILSIPAKRGESIFSTFHCIPFTEKVLSLLETLEFDHLKELFSLSIENPDLHQKSMLHTLYGFKKYLPLLERLSHSKLIEILFIKDEKGDSVLHCIKVEDFFPLINNFNLEELQLLFSIKNGKGVSALNLHHFLRFQNAEGNTLFHFHNSLDETLLKKLTLNEFYDLLTIKNRKGKTPLHYFDIFEKLLPFLEKLSSEQLKTLFSIQDNEGYTPLYEQKSLTKSLPLLQRLSSDYIHSLFSIQNTKGKTPLHYANSVPKILPLLEKLTAQQFKDLLSIKTEENTTLLHSSDIFESIFPLLKKLSSNELKILFSIQNIEENIPLYYCEISTLQKLVPLVQELTSDELKTLFSIQNKEGNTLLHFEDTLETFLPLLKKLSPHQFLALFSIQNKEGRAPSHCDVLLKKTLALIEKLRPEELQSFFSIPDSRGRTLLHFHSTVQVIFPFLKKLPLDDLQNLFSLQNAENRTPLHDHRILERIFPWLEKLPFSQLLNLFSIQDNHFLSVLYYFDLFETLLPLLETFSADQLQQLFSIQNKNGEIPLHSPAIFEKFLPFLKKLNEESVILLLTIQNNEGKTPLHHYAIFKESLPFLQTQSPEMLTHLFSMQYSQGNTLLHEPRFFNKAFPLFDKLNEKVFHIENENGWKSAKQPTISLKWLTKTKTPFVQFSESEYPEKAQALKVAIDERWNTLVSRCKEGLIPEEYAVPLKELKAPLDVIIDRIVDQTAWIGTPPENEKESLRAFYSQLLINLDRILILSKNKNLDEQADILIKIAIVEREGRCAAAYQSEIEQAKLFLQLDSANNTQKENTCENTPEETPEEVEKKHSTAIEALLNHRAEACLIAFIQDLIQRNHGGDSHDFSQMLFSMGFTPVADPLPNLTVEECQMAIFRECTAMNMVSKFISSLSFSDQEQLQEWFFQNTPDHFGEEFIEKASKIKTQEQNLLKQTKIALEESEIAIQNPKLKNILIQNALEIFQSCNGGKLEFPLISINSLPQNLFDKLNEALIPQDLTEAEILEIEFSESNRTKMQQLLKEDASSEQRKELHDQIIKFKRAVIIMKSFAEQRIKLKALFDKSEIPLSTKDLAILIKEKQILDKAIIKLAKKEKINFKLGENGFPSDAVKRARRQKYAEPFFNENKLNGKGASELLCHINILEKSII